MVHEVPGVKTSQAVSPNSERSPFKHRLDPKLENND